ncbi:hypothetical protein AAVH_23641 [Aphelenchoides avenae]|nr:hypothetical protein AAVH_23641 [Aphelenchus avenae]
MRTSNLSASHNNKPKRKRSRNSGHSKHQNPLLLSTEVLIDVFACCNRSPTLDNVVVVSRKFSAYANRLPNLRSVDYIELGHGQCRGRYDVNADEKSSAECTLKEAFEALIGYASFSHIDTLCFTVGDKKCFAKFSRQLWERLANVVAKCEGLDIQGVDFSSVHADLLAKLSRCLRPSAVNFAGCLYGASPCVDNLLRSGSQDTTLMTVRSYRDGARHDVRVSDEAILRFLFGQQHPPSAEVTLSIDCATVTKTFLRDLIERASTATHDFALYVDCAHPDEQKGLEPYADHIEDDRFTTGQNAVYCCLPSGLSFLFYFEKGNFWSLRVGTKPQCVLKAVP